MRNALSILLFAGTLTLASCGGGGTNSASSSLRIPCLGGETFCIISCDLGCSQTGCSITEVAENQRLRFKFSDAVDPSTVNGASISIRTATGVAPNGRFDVAGSEVVFIPEVSTANGVSTFGFLRNESYIISMVAGAQSVKNLSGDGLSNDFTCTVVATQGIIDDDGAPPTVELISPAVLVNAPVNPTIVLRFSELIDTTPLQVSLSEASPIRVVLRGQLPNGECDSDSDGIALEGVPALSTELVGNREVTVVTYQPTVQLPGQSCITVRVTADLRDLSGKSAIPAKFVFLTEAGVSTPITITESFNDPTKQQSEISGGVWGGPAGPGARPGLIGGDGRHGSFDPSLGNPIGGGVFVWNVDNLLIPQTQSLTGQQYLVTDGRFFFTDMTVPVGQTIRFVGSVPPVIRVRGEVNIQGTIEVNGADAPGEIATGSPATTNQTGQYVTTFGAMAALTGQPGSPGGVGGGRGGKGGDRCLNAGPIIVGGQNLTNGQAGQNVRVPAGHAYAGSTGGTGGEGSLLTPGTGVWATPTPSLQGVWCSYFSPGGGGGGFSGPGGDAGTPNYTGTASIGALAASTPVGGGNNFSVLPFTPGPSYTSLDHFVIGGSGGGGGASHGYGIVAIGAVSQRFMAGHGGTGGGGSFALRSGGTLTIGASGVVSSRGGDGVLITGTAGAGSPQNGLGVSSPGGAGSGGSFLLQSGQGVVINGEFDARGGAGSRVDELALAQLRLDTQAGSGADGFYRVEAPNTNVSFVGTATPAFVAADNAGDLLDRDDLSGDTSLWYSTGLVFPPTWDRYELDVDLDGDGTVDITYTDSGAPGTQKAAELGGPITLPLVIAFQGANLNQAGTEPIGPIGPWREGIGAGAGQGINLDAVIGYRFTITYNRALFPDAVVKQLRVYAAT